MARSVTAAAGETAILIDELPGCLCPALSLWVLKKVRGSAMHVRSLLAFVSLAVFVAGCRQGSWGVDDDCTGASVAAGCDLVRAFQDERDTGPGELGFLYFCDQWEEGNIKTRDFCDSCELILEDKLDERIEFEVNFDEFCLVEEPEEQFIDYRTTLDSWREEVEEGRCSDGRIKRATGTCNDGAVLFLSASSGLDGSVRYYDADTGAFRTVTYRYDVVAAPCCGMFYWPTRFDCGDHVETEVLCELDWE